MKQDVFDRPRIVHEAETQRQHVRIRVPLEAEVGGRFFRVRDWSVGGVAFEHLDPPRAIGDIFEAKLFFPVEAMEFTLAVTCEVRHANPGSGVTGCQFLDLDASQLSLLQYFVGAYLSGELVQHGDVLAIAARQNFAKARNAGGGTGGRIAKGLSFVRRTIAISALAAIGLGLVAYIGAAIYHRMYVSDFDGYVSARGTSYVRAPIDGIVDKLALKPLDKVTKGSVVGSVTDPDGQAASLPSPCDCVAVATPASPGTVVQRNAPIAVLAPENTSMLVVVRLPSEKLRGIAAGNRATISSFDGQAPTGGTVVSLERYTPVEYSTEHGLPQEQSYAVLLIQPDRRFDLGQYAEPVRVRIDRLQIFSPRPPAAPRVS